MLGLRTRASLSWSLRVRFNRSRGRRNRPSGAPEFTAMAVERARAMHAVTREEKGDGEGGPRLRQARRGRHPKLHSSPAPASRSLSGLSASPTKIYSFLHICVDLFFFFLKKHSY